MCANFKFFTLILAEILMQEKNIDSRDVATHGNVSRGDTRYRWALDPSSRTGGENKNWTTFAANPPCVNQVFKLIGVSHLQQR